VTTRDDAERQPNWNEDVPWCDENCPKHDGKRCTELGFRPSAICEPAVRDLVQALKRVRAGLAPVSITMTPEFRKLCGGKT
jgi:hypothetical protein